MSAMSPETAQSDHALAEQGDPETIGREAAQPCKLPAAPTDCTASCGATVPGTLSDAQRGRQLRSTGHGLRRTFGNSVGGGGVNTERNVRSGTPAFAPLFHRADQCVGAGQEDPWPAGHVHSYFGVWHGRNQRAKEASPAADWDARLRCAVFVDMVYACICVALWMRTTHS